MNLHQNNDLPNPPEKDDPFFLLILASLPGSLVLAIAWYGTYTFVNGYIVKGLGYSNETWTAASLWFSAGMIFWPIVCTEISAKIGRRWTVTLSLLIASFFFLAISFTQNMIVIRFLLALMGFTVAANNVAWLPMVAQVSRKFPGRAFGINQITSALVGIGSMIAAGYVIDRLSYRTGFILFGLTCGICTLIFHVISRPLERRQQTKVLPFRKFSRRDLADLGTWPFLILLIAGSGLGVFNYHTINQLFPNLARDFYHLSEKGVGLIVALGRIPTLVILFILVRTIDRLNILRLYGVLMLLAGAMVFLIGRAGGMELGVGLYFAFYLFHGGIWGTEAPAYNASVEPRLRDSAFALMNVVATVALFGAGLVHNRMLALDCSLPVVFSLCGLIGVFGGSVIAVYSFIRSSPK